MKLRRMRSSNVQGFVSTVPTLYQVEEDYAPLYRNKQHYATLQCSVKTSLRAGGT